MFRKRLIIYLVRTRLGLRKFQPFMFTNQKSDGIYYFTEYEVVKMLSNGEECRSSVSLNWLLDDKCEITTDVAMEAARRTMEGIKLCLK